MATTTQYEPEYEFQLWQGGICVAVAGATHLSLARREIEHYAMMYSQDGPCEIRGPFIVDYSEIDAAISEPEGMNPK